MTVAKSDVQEITNSSPTPGGVLSRTSNEGTGVFEPRYVRLRRPVRGRRWVLDRPSFFKVFVGDERPVYKKLSVYGLTDGIVITCKAVYGWETNVFRGRSRRLRDLNEILPTTPTWVRRDKCKGFILSRESFKEIFVDSDLTQEEAKRTYGISHQAMIRAVKTYSEFRDALAIKHGRHLSAAKRKEETFFPKSVLAMELSEGRSFQEIAAKFGVGESIILMDMYHHGVSANSHGTMSWMSRLTNNEYSALVALNPRVGDLPTDPKMAFTELVEAYQRLMQLAHSVKQSGSIMRALVERGTIERDHLTFSSNRAEMRLSRALTSVGIRHRRLFHFFKNWQADFAWPDQKLLVEVDGEWHQTCTATKARDRRKARKAKELGYRIVRFTTKQVDKNLPTVVRKIAAELGHKLPASLQSASKMSGTSL